MTGPAPAGTTETDSDSDFTTRIDALHHLLGVPQRVPFGQIRFDRVV